MQGNVAQNLDSELQANNQSTLVVESRDKNEVIEGRWLKAKVSEFVTHSKTHRIHLNNKVKVKLRLQFFTFVLYDPLLHEIQNIQVRSS